jgi:hypothetical protein
VVERKRGAAKIRSTGAKASNRDPELGTRRGRLALDEGPALRRDPVEHVPLPGTTGILDVSQFDLEGFEEPSRDLHERYAPEETAAPRLEEPAPQWQPEPVTQAPVQVFQPEPAVEAAAPVDEAPEQTWQPEPDFAAPQAAPALQQWQPEPAIEAIPHGAQVFQPSAAEPEPEPVVAEPIEPRVEEQPAFDAPLPPPDFAEPPTAHDFSRPASTRAWPEAEFVPCDPIELESDAQDEPMQRLTDEADKVFEPVPPRVRPGSIFAQKPAPGLFTQPLNAQTPTIGWEFNARQAPAADADAAPEAEAQPAQAVAIEPEPALDPASARIVATPLEELSQLELLERLALSMRHMRARPEPAMAEQPQAQAEPAPAPAFGAQPEPELERAEAPAESRPAWDAPAAPPVPVIPAGLRPIGFDEHDDDADVLPAFVPPRHFAQPEPAVAATGVSIRVEDDLDDGYSSLLSLSRPGASTQRFVRIEEPEAASPEIEPVVVFPGKEPNASANPADGPFARSAPASALQNASEQGAAPEQSASNPVSRIDAEETARALRAALANIQRMSGAA